MEKKIEHCIIKQGRYENTIVAVYDDQTEDVLTTYYPDERIYAERDFVGLTKKQAIDFITKATVNYLRN